MGFRVREFVVRQGSRLVKLAVIFVNASRGASARDLTGGGWGAVQVEGFLLSIFSHRASLSRCVLLCQGLNLNDAGCSACLVSSPEACKPWKGFLKP